MQQLEKKSDRELAIELIHEMRNLAQQGITEIDEVLEKNKGDSA